MDAFVRWLSLALIATFLLVSGSLRSASADPPPWAGKWKHHGHHDEDEDEDENEWWRHHDRDEWKHHRRTYRGDDARCAEILDRMHFDHSKVREIEPTGRHRKALQWYRDDLGNAQNDLDRCRHGG